MNEDKDKGNEKNNGQDFLDRINITTEMIEFMSKRLFLAVWVWSVAIILIVLALYFYHFSDGFSTDPSAWGQFGDYVGGILNPAFSYVALVLLLFTIIIQSQQLKKSSQELELSRKELELTREQLERSADAQKEQSETLKKQLEVQNRTFEQTERSKAIEIIYGPEFKDNPRVKAEAVKTFVLLERNRIAREQKEAEEYVTEAPFKHINLREAQLVNLDLYGFDLHDVNFSKVNLSSATLTQTNLTESFFIEAHLFRTNLLRANLSHANFMRASLPHADLTLAILEKTILYEANLNNVLFEGAILTNANLTGADIKEIKNWRTIESIKGANITGVKNAPEGFIEWALENGAVRYETPDSETTEQETEDNNDPFQTPK